MKKLAILSMLVALVFVVTRPPQHKTQAAVVHSNRASWSNIESLEFTDAEFVAHGFTTDNQEYVINSITVRLRTFAPASPKITLFADVGNQIGTGISTLGFITGLNTSGVMQEVTFTGLTPTVLSPNTTYWLVFTAGTSTGIDISDDNGETSPASGLWETVYYTDGGLFNLGSTSSNGYNLMIEIDASVPSPTDPIVPVVPTDKGQYSKIGQVQVVAPGSPLYDSAGGSVVRDSAGHEVWVPNQSAANPNEDIYDVLGQIEIEGTLWVEIFLGDSQAPVWLPLGANVTRID